MCLLLTPPPKKKSSFQLYISLYARFVRLLLMQVSFRKHLNVLKKMMIFLQGNADNSPPSDCLLGAGFCLSWSDIAYMSIMRTSIYGLIVLRLVWVAPSCLHRFSTGVRCSCTNLSDSINSACLCALLCSS